MDDWGYVYATIPSNTSKKVPVICFCAHMDTSPDASGAHVKPMVHKNYRGKDIKLPDNPQVVLSPKRSPLLKQKIGEDIITASGTTLLGADNKAGVAAIMDLAAQLKQNPELKHGTIKILFTPDEEIGRGVQHVDLKKLGADFAYTIDGSELGSIENETFSADEATIEFTGLPTHPGFAKGKMVNAIKVAAYFLTLLPAKLSPEKTSKKEGFIHPVSTSGGIEKSVVKLILRDFDDQKLRAQAKLIKKLVKKSTVKFKGARANIVIKEQYRNMKNVLAKCPEVVEFAISAMKRTGIKRPNLTSIRGGTDGSQLSAMGLPCPNIFVGEHAFHSPYEWVSVQDMEASVRTMVELVQIWEQESYK
jgi:tripeptide aminopeptidase